MEIINKEFKNFNFLVEFRIENFRKDLKDEKFRYLDLLSLWLVLLERLRRWMKTYFILRSCN